MLIEPKTRNVVQIGIGMCCVFFAFTSQGFIVETVLAGKHRSDSKISEHAGYYSQTIVYGAFIFSNAVAPVFLKIMNVKWSLVLGSSTYTLFMLGFQFLNPYYLYVSSAIEGFGAGLLWTAFGHSIAINSNENTIARNSSIAWIIYSSSFIYGGVFLVAMFGHDKRVTISDQTMHQLYGAFAAVCFLGNITFALLPSKMEDCNTDVPAASTTENGLSDCLNELKASWNLLLQPKMFFLCFIFAYSGMELSFWSSVYSTSLSFTKLFKINTNVLIGLNSICVGVGELFAGIAFGVFGKRTMGLISYVLTVINLPSNSPYEDSYGKSLITPSVPLALAVGIMLGFTDACVNTQIYSFVTVAYEHQTRQAFAIHKFFHAVSCTVCMFYGSNLKLQWQLTPLGIAAIIAALTFFIAEKHSTVFKKAENDIDRSYSL